MLSLLLIINRRLLAYVIIICLFILINFIAMGISGLLPFLKKSSVNTNVREFSGCTVAVDAYCWLHKGAFSCADKLVKGEKTDA